MKSEVYAAELILMSHFGVDRDCVQAQKNASSVIGPSWQNGAGLQTEFRALGANGSPL
jgi:hypothetical protein